MAELTARAWCAAGHGAASQCRFATLLAICGLRHRQSDLDIFVVAMLGPDVALCAVLMLGTLVDSCYPKGA